MNYKLLFFKLQALSIKKERMLKTPVLLGFIFLLLICYKNAHYFSFVLYKILKKSETFHYRTSLFYARIEGFSFLVDCF